MRGEPERGSPRLAGQFGFREPDELVPSVADAADFDRLSLLHADWRVVALWSEDNERRVELLLLPYLVFGSLEGALDPPSTARAGYIDSYAAGIRGIRSDPA